MVECASDKLQADLIARAEGLIAKQSDVPVVLEDAATGRKIHSGIVNGNTVLVHHVTVMDLDPEDLPAWFANFATNAAKCANAALKINLLDDVVNGRKIGHHRTVPPVPLVSPRSTLVTYYEIPGADQYTFMASSEGNEELVKKYADKVGSDVIASMFVNYMNFKPHHDSSGELVGCKVTHVIEASPNGSIPEMVMKKMSAAQQDIIIDFCKAIMSK